jgi:hypothetical protein
MNALEIYVLLLPLIVLGIGLLMLVVTRRQDMRDGRSSETKSSCPTLLSVPDTWVTDYSADIYDPASSFLRIQVYIRRPEESRH